MKQSKYHNLVRILPRRLIYFATIHLIAETTTGKYSKTIASELTALEAIKRFSDDNNIK